MTDTQPNYTAIKPSDETPPDEYTTHERRADLLRRIQEAGSPFAITQAHEAERYGVHESTVSRDMDRLRESIDAHLALDAKLTTRVLFASVVDELLDADDWRATKAAWDVVMDWNEWLADLGEQHREPQRAEHAVGMHARSVDVAYRVVRTDDGEPLELDGDRDTVDYDALGFAAGPPAVDADASEHDGDGS